MTTLDVAYSDSSRILASALIRGKWGQRLRARVVISLAVGDSVTGEYSPSLGNREIRTLRLAMIPGVSPGCGLGMLVGSNAFTLISLLNPKSLRNGLSFFPAAFALARMTSNSSSLHLI